MQILFIIISCIFSFQSFAANNVITIDKDIILEAFDYNDKRLKNQITNLFVSSIVQEYEHIPFVEIDDTIKTLLCFKSYMSGFIHSNLDRAKDNPEKLTSYLVKYHSKVIGIVILEKFAIADWQSISINLIAIDLNYQRKGVGTKIINEIPNLYPDAHEILATLRDDNNAVKFYNKNGFIKYIYSKESLAKKQIGMRKIIIKK